MNRNVLELIKDNMNNFSKSQKKIAKYIFDNYEKAAFITAAKLGDEVGVSESTVVRFANIIGFKGYPQLLDALRKLINQKSTSMQRIEITSNRIDKDYILKSILKSDSKNIKETLEQIDEKNFNNVIDTILGAKKIYILGVRSSSILSDFLGYYLNLILDNIKLVNTNNFSEVLEQIYRIDKYDIFIGISFPRYSNTTIRAMEYSQSKCAKIVSITDSELSPLTDYSDYNLFAKSNMASFVDSLVAPLSLINAIIVALSIRKKDEIKASFDILENIWERYDVYNNSEILSARKEKIDD